MRRAKIQLLIPTSFALLFIVLCAFAHPFYLSVTDLNYKTSEKKLEGSVRIFANDLETSISKIQGKAVNILNSTDKVKTGKLLETYIQERLIIEIDKKPVLYKVLGFEREEESIWIYLESSDCPFPKHLNLTNTLLYEFSKEQSNIVQLDVDGKKQSGKVSFPEKILIFEF